MGLFHYSGESASILMEQRQNKSGSQLTDKKDIREDENKGRKSNHASVLQRNERQFYDNLLVTIYSFTMLFVEYLLHCNPLNVLFVCPKASLNALVSSSKKKSWVDTCPLVMWCIKHTGVTEKSAWNDSLLVVLKSSIKSSPQLPVIVLNFKLKFMLSSYLILFCWK